MSGLGIVAFALALLASVMLHEAGHFVTARHYGMKASQFFVGFGPTLFSRRRGETEYGVKAIPAGGFVKIVGMTSLEEVAPGDEERAFYRQPARQRAVVLAAGSVVHFLIAVLVVFLVTLGIGVPDDTAPVLTAPAACVPVTLSATSVPPAGCPAGATVPAPAAAAGLRAGDRVLTAAGQRVATYPQLTRIIRAHPGQPLPLVVSRDGQRRMVTVTPALVTRPDLLTPSRLVQVGVIGVGQEVVAKHVGLVGSVHETGTLLGQIVTGTYDSLTHKLHTLAGIYGPHRDPNGLVGVVGAANVSGQILASGGVSLSVRVAELLLLIAGLNLFVGVFNLLPLPPLDGGHLAVLGFEQARHGLRRLRGYRGPVRQVDFNRLLPVTAAVIALFVVLVVYILGADIVNPIRLGQ